jgi:hypothetical protein
MQCSENLEILKRRYAGTGLKRGMEGKVVTPTPRMFGSHLSYPIAVVEFGGESAHLDMLGRSCVVLGKEGKFVAGVEVGERVFGTS